MPGVVVKRAHLDRAFAWIAGRLANPKITLRAKQRIPTAAAPS